MDATHAPHEDGAVAPDGVPYPTWINDGVRAELRRLRLQCGKTPHALAVSGQLARQTIVNIEAGTHSPSVRTVALLCQRLGTTFDALVLAVVRPDRRALAATAEHLVPKVHPAR